MKMFLFIMSLLGFATSAYFLVTDLITGYALQHIIYLLLLLIMVFNGFMGMVLTYPAGFFKKRNR